MTDPLKERARRAADIVTIRAKLRSSPEFEDSVVIRQRADELAQARSEAPKSESIPARAKAIVAVLNALGKLPVPALVVITVLLGVLAFLGPDLVKAIWQ